MHAPSPIHRTAVVSPKAHLGKNVIVGPYAVIHEDVTIGDDTEIGAHVVIDKWTTLGRRNKVFPGAVLGTQSQDLKYKGAKTYLTIGDHNVIREYVTINRATVPDGRTVVGHHNALLAYCHVAHDCVIGNHVTISNVTTLAGHVRVDDRAGLGGYVGVHQFCRIGTMAYVGGWSKIVKDVPPFIRASGAPLRVYGLNTVGLERNEVPAAARRALRKAYGFLYRQNLNVTQAIEAIRRELDQGAEIEHLLAFLLDSQRGIVKNTDPAEEDTPDE